ncbi:MAG: DMT family transporter [Spirochaetia bacterium]
MDNKKALLTGLAAILLWSTAGTAFKLTLRYLGPLQTVFYSSLASTAVLAIIGFFRKGYTGFHVPKFRSLLPSAAYGLLNPLLYYSILFFAYDQLLAQEALVLNYAWPLLLAVIFLIQDRQAPKIGSIFAFLLSIAGVVLVAAGPNISGYQFSSPLGIAAALSSALIWALYWFANNFDPMQPLDRLFWNFLFGSFYMGIFLLLSGGFQVPSLYGIAGSIYIGLFEMGITFALWITALKGAHQKTLLSNLVYISPFLSLVWINIVLKEPLYWTSLLGLVIILSGILLQHRSSKKQHKVEVNTDV